MRTAASSGTLLGDCARASFRLLPRAGAGEAKPGPNNRKAEDQRRSSTRPVALEEVSCAAEWERSLLRSALQSESITPRDEHARSARRREAKTSVRRRRSHHRAPCHAARDAAVFAPREAAPRRALLERRSLRTRAERRFEKLSTASRDEQNVQCFRFCSFLAATTHALSLGQKTCAERRSVLERLP